MSRPALSASRSIDIIEFLASFPDRSFTLSEIVRATRINVGSCHAVLTALTDRGYLIRYPDQKSYSLGSSLIAVGQAAFISQPIVERARLAAEELRRELGVSVLLSTVVGEEILSVFSLKDSSGRGPRMRLGERVPLVAPIGMPFLAWAPEEAVEAWIARCATPSDQGLTDGWRHDLELTRRRGYQVTLGAPSEPTIASLMADMASRRRVSDYKDEVTQLINKFDHHMSQPETIKADELYDVLVIASPLFDQNGEAAFNLCLDGFPQRLNGAQLTSYAERLMRACLEIMRADRSQTRRR